MGQAASAELGDLATASVSSEVESSRAGVRSQDERRGPVSAESSPSKPSSTAVPRATGPPAPPAESMTRLETLAAGIDDSRRLTPGKTRKDGAAKRKSEPESDQPASGTAPASALAILRETGSYRKGMRDEDIDRLLAEAQRLGTQALRESSRVDRVLAGLPADAEDADAPTLTDRIIGRYLGGPGSRDGSTAESSGARVARRGREARNSWDGAPSGLLRASAGAVPGSNPAGGAPRRGARSTGRGPAPGEGGKREGGGRGAGKGEEEARRKGGAVERPVWGSRAAGVAGRGGAGSIEQGGGGRGARANYGAPRSPKASPKPSARASSGPTPSSAKGNGGTGTEGKGDRGAGKGRKMNEPRTPLRPPSTPSGAPGAGKDAPRSLSRERRKATPAAESGGTPAQSERSPMGGDASTPTGKGELAWADAVLGVLRGRTPAGGSYARQHRGPSAATPGAKPTTSLSTTSSVSTEPVATHARGARTAAGHVAVTRTPPPPSTLRASTAAASPLQPPQSAPHPRWAARARYRTPSKASAAMDAQSTPPPALPPSAAPLATPAARDEPITGPGLSVGRFRARRRTTAGVSHVSPAKTAPAPDAPDASQRRASSAPRGAGLSAKETKTWDSSQGGRADDSARREYARRMAEIRATYSGSSLLSRSRRARTPDPWGSKRGAGPAAGARALGSEWGWATRGTSASMGTRAEGGSGGETATKDSIERLRMELTKAMATVTARLGGGKAMGGGGGFYPPVVGGLGGDKGRAKEKDGDALMHALLAEAPEEDLMSGALLADLERMESPVQYDETGPVKSEDPIDSPRQADRTRGVGAAAASNAAEPALTTRAPGSKTPTSARRAGSLRAAMSSYSTTAALSQGTAQALMGVDRTAGAQAAEAGTGEPSTRAASVLFARKGATLGGAGTGEGRAAASGTGTWGRAREGGDVGGASEKSAGHEGAGSRSGGEPTGSRAAKGRRGRGLAQLRAAMGRSAPRNGTRGEGEGEGESGAADGVIGAVGGAAGDAAVGPDGARRDRVEGGDVAAAGAARRHHVEGGEVAAAGAATKDHVEGGEVAAAGAARKKGAMDDGSEGKGQAMFAGTAAALVAYPVKKMAPLPAKNHGLDLGRAAQMRRLKISEKKAAEMRELELFLELEKAAEAGVQG